jgi:hypothetical protein
MCEEGSGDVGSGAVESKIKSAAGFLLRLANAGDLKRQG